MTIQDPNPRRVDAGESTPADLASGTSETPASARTEKDFAQAMKAFDLFTLSERLRALRIFAGLRYPLVEDRFLEAVHRVIKGSASYDGDDDLFSEEDIEYSGGGR